VKDKKSHLLKKMAKSNYGVT